MLFSDHCDSNDLRTISLFAKVPRALPSKWQMRAANNRTPWSFPKIRYARIVEWIKKVPYEMNAVEKNGVKDRFIVALVISLHLDWDL